MFNEIDLITHLATETGYTVDYAVENTAENLTGTITTPLVFVGFAGVKLQDQGRVWANGYDEVDNPKLLIIEIQVMCARTSLAAVVLKVAKAYGSFSPFPADGNYSNLAFVEAKMEMATKYNAYWKEFVGLVFPQNP